MCYFKPGHKSTEAADRIQEMESKGISNVIPKISLRVVIGLLH